MPQCNQAQIDAGLNEVRALGVSTFFPVHKFDNAFGGTKMDAGELGVLINGGNHLETGQLLGRQDLHRPRARQRQHDHRDRRTAALARSQPAANGAGASAPGCSAATPAVAAGLSAAAALQHARPHEPRRVPDQPDDPGSTSSSQLDHMDAKTADDALSILEAHHYSGVVSAHSLGLDPQENPRIYNLGGFVTPIAGASPQAFIDQWQREPDDPQPARSTTAPASATAPT